MRGGYRGSVSGFPWKILCLSCFRTLFSLFSGFPSLFIVFWVFSGFPQLLKAAFRFPQFSKTVHRYFQVFRFSVAQKYHFPVSGTLLFPVSYRFFSPFLVFSHFFGAFPAFHPKYNAPSVFFEYVLNYVQQSSTTKSFTDLHFAYPGGIFGTLVGF